MKVLQFILWPILLFCLVWAGAILLGPFLITKAAYYLSDGSVNLTRVEVSPKLKISAVAVGFEFPQGNGGEFLVGTARALSIGWKTKNGFGLIGHTGQSNLKDYGTLSSTNFTLQPTSIFDWSEVSVKLKFEQLGGANFELLRGDFKGKFTNSFKELKDAELVVPKILGEVEGVSFEFDSIKAKMDLYRTDQPLIKQKSEITFSSQNIILLDGIFEGSRVEGDLRLLNGYAVIEVSTTNAQLTNQKLTAGSLTLVSRQSISTNAFNGAWEFSASAIELKDPAINIENYSGDLTLTPSGVAHTGSATISGLELKTNQYFIGQIENAMVDIVISSRVLPSRAILEGQAVLTLKELDDFRASVSIASSLSTSNILECFSQKCELGGLAADYQITASNDSLIGSLKCKKADCLNRPTQHVIQTDNTNRFFQTLSSFGILSPLALPIAFTLISNGEVVGNGHVLNF